jgi:L-seryl-tRNA(Ser) seleniumtransferase
VHPSNFRIEGFVERASIGELVALGRRFSLPVVEDHGSGLLPGTAGAAGAFEGEVSVTERVAAGVDLVCFSGDKLLGGPQAGIIVGKAALVARLRAHPLMRALRVDKLTYAALEATLLEHLSGRAAETVPVLRMASIPAGAIGARAEVLASALRTSGWKAEVIDGASTIGGGSVPGSTLPTRLVALSADGWSPDRLDARLRTLDPPIVARIEADRVVIDLRTVAPGDDEALATLIGQAP